MREKVLLELKVEALRLLKTGLSVSSVSKQLKIPSGVLQTWSQIYAKGRPIYGPNETYVYNLHEGPWTEAVENNRQLFRRAQVLAREELKDPERLAYWQPLFDKQFKHPHSGQKHYATILGFVVAQIHAQLKEENQNQDTTPSDSAV